MAYSINICINENTSAVFLEFNYLSNEYRIVRICRFQCIGWILDAVSQVEVEVQNGATWMNPEASVDALMRFPKIPESLARRLIATDSKDERFDLAWNHISDEEKNTAITVNFDYYHNFWPRFHSYAKAIALHVANTQQLNDFREKALNLERDLRQSSTIRTQIADTLIENVTPTSSIHCIENKRWHSNNNGRQVIYNPIPPSPSDKCLEDNLY